MPGAAAPFSRIFVEAHDASYLAESARIVSFSARDGTKRIVPRRGEHSAKPLRCQAISGNIQLMSTIAPTRTDADLVALTKAHTIFEWSAQSKVDPIPVAGAEGCWFWTPE